MMSLSNNGGFAEEADAFCHSCGGPFTRGGRKTNQSEKYDGVIHKCPNCGQTVDAFEAQCPSCGFEFRGVEPSSRVNDLAMKLERVSDIERRNELKKFFIYRIQGKIFSSSSFLPPRILRPGEKVRTLGTPSLAKRIRRRFLYLEKGRSLRG